MKKLSVILFAGFAITFLAACQGGSNNNPGTTTAACTQTTTVNAYGQAVPGCVSPNSAYNSQYGYGTSAYGAYGAYGSTGYAGYGSNPCASYYYQYGVMYYPSMVGSTMMCVASQ